jgi:hypothetical protein
MIAGAILGCAGAMLLVRLGWGGVRGAAAAGWGLALVALTVLASVAGAWGIAAGCVAGMAAATGIVLHAAWSAPAKVRRPTREPASITLPRRAGDFARRVAVFVLVVPVAFVAAQWCAFGMQAFARELGGGDADATVLALFAQPVLWAALMAWQMTRSGPVAMVAPPALAAAAGTILWGIA